MRFLLLFLIFFTYTFAHPGFAQTSKEVAYSIKNYTDEDGLPQNSIRNIVVDRLGFVWLTTNNGLVRFDGDQFSVSDKINIAPIRSSRFTNVIRGVKNKLYAVSDKNDCIRIENGKFFCETPHGRALIELDLQLYKHTKRSSLWAACLPQNNFHKPAETSSFAMTLGAGRFITFELNKIKFIGVGKGHSDTAIDFAYTNFSDFFLLNDELFHLNENGSFSNIGKYKIATNTLSGDILEDKMYHHQKEGVAIFWNIAMKSTLIYFNQSFYTIKRQPNGQLQTHLILSDFDIASKQIVSHFYDEKNKRLFLGSEVKGLFVIQQKKFNVLSEKGGDDASTYYAMVPYSANSVLTAKGTWLGVDVWGKSFVTPKAGSLLDDSRTMLADNKGFFWIKEFSSIHKCDRDLNKLESWMMPAEVNVLYESNDGTLWIGLKEKGLYKMKSPYLNAEPVLVCDLPDITFIEAETLDRLWVGTKKGIFFLDLSSKKVSSINRLKQSHILSVFAKQPGEVWITTNEEGIFLYRNKVITDFPNDRESFMATAHCMILDEGDYFWISTSKGLFRASRIDLLSYADDQQSELFYQYFSKDDGFNTNEFNGNCQPCGLNLESGNITFPSLDGIVLIKPQTVNAELPDNRFVIDRVSLDNKEIHSSDTLLLSRNFEQLKIKLSTVYFGNRKNVQIAYSLNKGDDPQAAWYTINGDQNISFSTLASGNYKLHIRKTNGFGKKNYTEKVIIIIVAKAFYETIWFKILLLMLAAFGVYLYFRIRYYYVIQTNKTLEIRIARRTRKLTNTLRALESSESELRRQTQIQEMLIAAISHDIKNPMKYLLLVSKKMQDYLHKKDYSAIGIFNDGIQDTASRIFNILDNLLKYITIQVKGGNAIFEQIEFFDLVEEKVKLFSAIAQTNFTRIENQIPRGVTVYSNLAIISVVVHNLLDNAVKFTANGSIILSFETDSDMDFFVIDDSGTGIDAEMVEWINNSTESSVNAELISTHKGMGLIIVKELLASINATIEVQSNSESGTKIWIGISSNTDR